MTKYVERKDREGWTEMSGRIFKLCCCDCGLVHRAVIVADGEEIGIAVERDARATGQRRRHDRRKRGAIKGD